MDFRNSFALSTGFEHPTRTTRRGGVTYLMENLERIRRSQEGTGSAERTVRIFWFIEEELSLRIGLRCLDEPAIQALLTTEPSE